MAVPPGATDDNQMSSPSKSLLKRIDIGLMTGLCALLISFVGILTSRATFKMNQETQKARVLPIIDIDLGYLTKATARGDVQPHFEITLNNFGTGLANIQSVSVLQKGEPVTGYKAFEDAIMTPRLRGWARLTEKPAAGYLRAGDSVTPISFSMGSPGSELTAYLRGQWGTPMDGVDVSVCYCSVFDDCWTVKFLDKKAPQPAKDCGITDIPKDNFQTYIDQRAAARQKSN
ncbi:hypothetical protein [Hellea balneolensis]|uniref:hypothetical protein n=1 Tax=Hellea balneolensis TaxID=287478 RepID=UPI00047E1720|nr:hypothetical protein [Hellea balneolensis]